MAQRVKVQRDTPLFANNIPIYQQVREILIDRIERDEYPLGSMLPSENELADEFGITRLTVRNAMDALVERGLIRRIQGKGAFVWSGWTDVHTKIRGFREKIESVGGSASVRILACSKRPAGPYYADLFGIEPDDLLYSVRRLNSADDCPVSIENVLIPLALFSGIEDVDISVFSLYETYEMYGHKVDKVQMKLNVEALGARDAGLLNLDADELALVFECISYDKEGTIVEYARSLNRGDAGGYLYTY